MSVRVSKWCWDRVSVPTATFPVAPWESLGTAAPAGHSWCSAFPKCCNMKAGGMLWWLGSTREGWLISCFVSLFFPQFKGEYFYCLWLCIHSVKWPGWRLLCRHIRCNLFAGCWFSQSCYWFTTLSLGKVASQLLVPVQRCWMKEGCSQLHTAGAASLLFHKINVFMLLQNYCAASLIAPASCASPEVQVSFGCHTCWITFILTWHKAHSGQPV